MIEKNGGKYHLVCDNCGEEHDEDFDSWDEAVDFKRESDWFSKIHGGGWADICPSCGGAGK